MDGYTVLVVEEFWKHAKNNIPHQYQDLIKKKLDYFKENIRHPSLNTKPYSCSGKVKEVLRRIDVDEVWEFYVNRKKYRCVFYVCHSSKEIIVVYIGTHDQIRNKYS
jgi:mRNA-degrading endonuclease HigB of HigAB toxin-antitoxin module